MRSSLRPLVAAALALVPLVRSAAQEGVPAPPGLVPETMWYAPTAEDWQKPVLIQWQRTWDDAVKLAQETKRPILVCINMDGEIASEHYAGVRYRSAEIAALYEPYVCVIASVYRHNARDYDEQGRRIPCPRLGCVTCGEHIAIEPLLYEKFMNGKRISPRHIMVELDGSTTYDVYYMWDTDSVFQAIKDGIANRPQTPPLVRGDRSLRERVASPDSVDRQAVEAEFLGGDAAARRALLEAAVTLGKDAPIELLRLAARSFDVELAKRARAALAAAQQEGAVDLVADTLRAPLAADERQQLVAALERLGTRSGKAKMLATVHRGLDARPTTVDVQGWTKSLTSGTYAAAQDVGSVQDRYAAAADQAASGDSAAARLALAEASLEQALAEPGTGARGHAQRFRRLLFADAERQATTAGKLVQDWRVAAVQAVCADEAGDREQAHAHAVRAMAEMPADAPGRIAARVLTLFALARQDAIATAVQEKRDWPPSWMTDVHSAYAVLLRHPFGTDQHVAWHWDFLDFFGAAQAPDVLDQGLARYPQSALLHERWRKTLLTDGDADALEAAYAARLAASAAPPPSLHWFAGYASLVAAEAHRRKGANAKATASYDRGAAAFERSIAGEPSYQDSADHYVAIAFAGKARVALQEGRLPETLDLLEAAFTRRPDATASPDGLNITTADTARMLRARLVDAKQDALRDRLDAALAKLPPAMLEPPEYEREGRSPPRRRRG
jgi:tetratricopeptide (TPR) repeat protein